MGKKYILIGVIVVLVIGGIILFRGSLTGKTTQTLSTSDQIEAVEGITKGKLAKDFSLVTIDGDVVRLSDFRGRHVLFAAMATWCIPCQIEAENVKRAQNNFEHLPLVVMQIDVDLRESKQDLIDFRNEFGKEDWIMGFDDGTITGLYNIRTFDTTLVVDPDGEIIYRDNGFPIDTKTLEDLIVRGESAQLVLGSTHEHARIKVTVDGDEVDFSQPSYQLRSSFVHFEGGEGETIHKHADGVTLKYLFGTFGWEYSFGLESKESCLKTDFGNYCDGALEVLVNGNGESLDYEFGDGDVIEVRYG